MAAVVLNEAVSGGGGGRPGCMTSHVGGGGGGSLESYRYYVSRGTVMEMLSDRGYNVADSDLTRSFTKFRTAFGRNPDLDLLTICVSLSSNSKNKIMVMFCGTDEIRKASVRDIHAILLNKDISSLMLVLQSKMNSSKRTAPYAFARYYGLEKEQLCVMAYKKEVNIIDRFFTRYKSRF